MPDPAHPPASPGLRERKKKKTYESIRAHALELFARNGYGATTVQQIAEAAEVSESTFFRYFPTKEDVVLQDELDPAFFAELSRLPGELSDLQAVRHATATVLRELPAAEQRAQQERLALVSDVPELRARLTDEFFSGAHLMAQALAGRHGLSEPDLGVRALAGAIIGAMLAVTLDPSLRAGQPLADAVDEALRALETASAP